MEIARVGGGERFPELYGRPGVDHEFLRERGPNPLVEWVLERGHDLRVLELGCGVGNDAEALLRSGQLAAYWGVDVSARALRHHAQRCRDAAPATERALVEGDVREVLARPWTRPPVDVVYAYSSLHYFPQDDIVAVLRASAAAATSDAVLVLGLKGPGSVWDGRGAAMGPRRWRNPDGVVRWFPSPDEVAAVVRRAGWHVVRREERDHWGYSERGGRDRFTYVAATRLTNP